MGPGKRRRRAELAPIDAKRLIERVGREMRGEGIRQAKRGGELRAEQAGAEDPHLRAGTGTGGGGDAGLAVIGEIALQFEDVAGERVGVAVEGAAHGAGDALVGAGGAAEAEVDAAGEECVQGTELFGDDERGVVGQHDAARADADGAGGGGDMGDHHRGRGRGDALHAVMLGHPIALIAERFGMGGEVGGIGQRLRHGATFDDGHQIEQGKTGHASADGKRGRRSQIKNGYQRPKAQRSASP